MATKFKFEIESDGLTPSQTTAFAAFINALGGQASSKDTAATQHHFGTCLEEKITPDYAEGIKKDIVEAGENTKKKRASRAKVEEVQAEEFISETPMQIDARNMDTIEEPQAEEFISETPMQIDARNMDTIEEPQAEEPQAEEPQAEEVQAEEVQAEETKTSAFSIQDVRDRVKEKQGKWRTSIKAELERLGSSSVSLLAPEHFEEFCNFMDNLA